MHNELTRKDIELMRKELDDRRIRLRPQLLEEVKVARAFGDLSENFEYKAAKREKNRNESRIRYLENMIKTAVIVPERTDDGTAGLYDFVTVFTEDDGEEQEIQLVTTVRQNALQNRISKESPFGRAILGRAVGDRVYVRVNESFGYYVIIRAIRKGADDESVPISEF